MGNLKNFLNYMALKKIRLISFLIFGSRKGLYTPLGSFISPKEVEAQQSMKLEAAVGEIKEYLRVCEIKAPLVRMGSTNDGGYVMAEQSLSGSFLISGGIETNNDFEIALAAQGASGVEIDFSISAPPIQHPRLSFLPLKIVGASESGPGAIRIESLISDHIQGAFRENSMNILKLDIEGSEWDALNTNVDFSLFSQILLELHYFNRLVEEDFLATAVKVLREINKTHVAVFLSGNNCCGYSILGGHALPNVMEVTFVSREKFEIRETLEPHSSSGLKTRNIKNRAAISFW
jgi:hypothetical protein